MNTLKGYESIPTPPPLPRENLCKDLLHICPGIGNFVTSTVDVKKMAMCFDYFCPYCHVGYSFCTNCRIKMESYNPSDTYPLNNVMCLFCGNWCAIRDTISRWENRRDHRFLKQNGCGDQ